MSEKYNSSKPSKACRTCGECCKHGGYIYEISQLGITTFEAKTAYQVFDIIGDDKEVHCMQEARTSNHPFYSISAKEREDGSCIHHSDDGGCDIEDHPSRPATCQAYQERTGGYNAEKDYCFMSGDDFVAIMSGYATGQSALKAAYRIQEKRRGRK